MNKLKHIVILLVLCLSLVLSQMAIGAPLETIKKDMAVVGHSFLKCAKISTEILGYLQYTDVIKGDDTTWYLIMTLIGTYPNMIYIQEEVTVSNGKEVHFDGAIIGANGWINDCYGYHINIDGTMDYLKECVKAWDRGIAKFKEKYAAMKR